MESPQLGHAGSGSPGRQGMGALVLWPVVLAGFDVVGLEDRFVILIVWMGESEGVRATHGLLAESVGLARLETTVLVIFGVGFLILNLSVWRIEMEDEGRNWIGPTATAEQCRDHHRFQRSTCHCGSIRPPIG